MQKFFRAKYVSLLAFLLGIIAVPNAGAAIDFIDLPQTTSTTITPAELDLVRTNLEACITAFKANDQLTELQSDMLRAKLCQNAKVEASLLSDGKLDVAEGQQVMRGLGGIEDVMQSSMRATISAKEAQFEGALMARTPVNKSIFNTRVYDYGNVQGEVGVVGAPYLPSNIARYNNLEFDLSAKLEDGYADGFITKGEYNMLKGKLTDLISRTQKIADQRCNFTWQEQAKMDQKLAKFHTELNNELSDNQVASAI